MSDVVLEDDAQVTVVCDNLNVRGHDLVLDSSSRRGPGGPRLRRALVHDEGDGLTVNFADDYPGGVTLAGVASITPRSQPHRLGLPRRPDLVVHGGITYEVEGIRLVGGGPSTVTLSVDGELNKLAARIGELEARVAQLEAH